jgi:hypothetical protein
MRWLILGFVAAGCSGGGTTPTDTDPGGGDTGPTGPTGPGTMILGVDLDPDLIPGMEDPALGPFRGSVFAEADAGPFGPLEGAVSLADFTTEPIDFGADGGLKEAVHTLEGIDPQIVWILGCLDVDANDCDPKDPVTIPNENKLQVTSGEAAYTLTLSILQP